MNKEEKIRRQIARQTLVNPEKEEMRLKAKSLGITVKALKKKKKKEQREAMWKAKKELNELQK